MPYTSVFCHCEGKRFPLDHWKSGACPDPPIYLPWLVKLVARLTGDTLHAAGNLTATRCLDCPVATLIGDYKDIYLDPFGIDSAMKGTAWHDWCEDAPAPGAMMELQFPMEDGPRVTLGGMEIAGKVDCYFPKKKWIHDLKGHGYWTQEFKDPEGKFAKKWSPDMDTAVQLSIYGLALRQLGHPVEELVAHHAGMGATKPWIKERLPFLSEAQILKHKPHRGEHTVEEIMAEHRFFWERHRKGMKFDDNIRLVRLLGRRMYFNDKSGVFEKCSRWCDKGKKGRCDQYQGIVSTEAMAYGKE